MGVVILDIKTIHSTTGLKNSSSITETSASSEDREPTQGGMHFQQDFSQKKDSYSENKYVEEDELGGNNQKHQDPVDIKQLLKSIDHQRNFNAMVRAEFARKIEDMV
jgi:hypothetical protein